MLGQSSSRDPIPEQSVDTESEDSQDNIPIGTLVQMARSSGDNVPAPGETENSSDRASSSSMTVPADLRHWIEGTPPLRHCREHILDGLNKLSASTNTSDRDGYTLKKLSSDLLLQGRSFRSRWLPNQAKRPYVSGDVHAAQLARCVWLFFEARRIFAERKPGDHAHCLRELNRLTHSYMSGAAASQPSADSGSGSRRATSHAFESEIVALKVKVEACLHGWNDNDFAMKSPCMDFQETYKKPTSRPTASAPPREACAKRKRQEARAKAAPIDTATTETDIAPREVIARVEQTPPVGNLVPLPHMDYDYAPLPDGTAVMLWSEYLDADGVTREVPIDGRPGWRPSFAPLAPGWRRAVVVDGVELVATQIQCGWARLRRV